MGVLNKEVMTNNIPEIMASVGLASFAGSIWTNLPETLKPVMAILGFAMVAVSLFAKLVDIYFKFKPRNNGEIRNKKHKES